MTKKFVRLRTNCGTGYIWLYWSNIDDATCIYDIDMDYRRYESIGSASCAKRTNQLVEADDDKQLIKTNMAEDRDPSCNPVDLVPQVSRKTHFYYKSLVKLSYEVSSWMIYLLLIYSNCK